MKKIICNAKRIHIRNKNSAADSILIEDDRILAIGNREQFTTEIRKGIPMIDAEQSVILPGFIDAHNHFVYMATLTQRIDLEGLLSKAGILNYIHEVSDNYPEDRPILCTNLEFDFIPPEERLSAEDLDRHFPHKVIQIEERTGHLSVTNKYTLQHAGIDWTESGCRCLRAPSAFTGEICGKVNSRLCQYFKKELFTPGAMRSFLNTAEKSALSKGVTGLHVMCCPSDFDILYEFSLNSPLHMRIFTETKDVEKVHSRGLSQIGGCGSVVVDGDTGPFTAAFFEPYLDCPKSKGILYYTDEELYEYVRAAHVRNMQVGLHCVGDAASDQLLRVYERLKKEDPRPLRHRIEHFEFADDAMVHRVKDADVCLSIQPNFNHLWPHESLIESLGETRALQSDRIGSLIKAGIHVGFGSDCPVTACDPLLTIYSAVNHSNPSERIDVTTAIDCHTWQSAYCGHEENISGSIEPGKRADMVFLKEDPLTVHHDLLKDIHVLQTMCSGEIVWQE